MRLQKTRHGFQLATLSAVLSAVIASAGAHAAAPPSTWAYWDFNDTSDPATAYDLVQELPGYLAGVVYTEGGGGISGEAGDHAVDFGSENLFQYVYIPLPDNSLNESNANDRITIAFWQKWNIPRVNAAAFRFISPTSANGMRGISAETPWGDGQIPFDTGGTGANQRIVRDIDNAPEFEGYDEQEWHHFAFVKDGSRKAIYIDGRLFHSGINTAPLPTDITEIVLGAEDSTGLNPARSLFDNFAIFTDALPQAAIEILATPGATLDDVADALGDDDGDGLPNWFEDQYEFDRDNAADAAEDPDDDSLTNLQEFERGTDPRNADTDGDGLPDGVETNTGTWVDSDDTGTDPRSPDTDGDGLPDGVETNTGTFVGPTDTGTNPLLADTDGDALRDALEIELGSSPVDGNSLPQLVNGSGRIIWVSFHEDDDTPSQAAADAGFTRAPDVTYTSLLRANGFEVTRYVTTPTPDIALLSEADLVIISRSVNSGAYQSADSTFAWHGISAPAIVMSGYIIRQSRLGFLTGEDIPDTIGPIRLQASDPQHPIFTGVNLGNDNVMTRDYAGVVTFDGTEQRGISVVTNPVAEGGTVLATVATESDPAAGGPVIIEFEEGTTLANASGDVLAGPRLIFLSGSREHNGLTGDGAGIFDLEADGTRLFLNAVAYMMGIEIEQPADVEFTSIRAEDGMLRLEWTGGGTLQSSEAVDGTWSDVPGAESPYTTEIGAEGARFFRIRR